MILECQFCDNLHIVQTAKRRDLLRRRPQAGVGPSALPRVVEGPHPHLIRHPLAQIGDGRGRDRAVVRVQRPRAVLARSVADVAVGDLRAVVRWRGPEDFDSQKNGLLKNLCQFGRSSWIPPALPFLIASPTASGFPPTVPAPICAGAGFPGNDGGCVWSDCDGWHREQRPPN